MTKNVKRKIMNALRKHPNLTTLALGLGITLVIGIMTGVTDPKLAYATGGSCNGCLSF